jgi:D-sedoheptulose 7-phosphate isomerase
MTARTVTAEMTPGQPGHDGARGYLDRYVATTLTATRDFAADRAGQDALIAMAEAVAAAMRDGGKLLVAGNGGSAADAQHIAGEIVGRLMFDRAPLPAVALTTDSSNLTAIGNDYGFDAVFERQVLALGARGDVFLGLSTSGNSRNVVRALQAARSRGMVTLGFTGRAPGAMDEFCDHLFRAPSTWTPVIQQIHIVAAHLVCALLEREMFPADIPAAAR